MQFKVMNQTTATEQYGSTLDHVLIGVKTEETYKVTYVNNIRRLDSLLLVFADLDEDTGAISVMPERYQVIGEKETRRFVIFDESLADRILDFYLEYKDKVKLMIVHCEAGWSRSPGIAAALSRIERKSDEMFFKNYQPNMKVYSTILKQANKRGLI